MFSSKALNSVRLLKINRSKGFTLIEVLAVVVILGILSIILVPNILGIIQKAENDVCNANVLELERKYESYLTLEDKDQSAPTFAQFLLSYGEDVCPVHGVISYVDEKLNCSIHGRENFNGDHNNGEEDVPFL